jgi:hypothetical protein
MGAAPALAQADVARARAARRRCWGTGAAGAVGIGIGGIAGAAARPGCGPAGTGPDDYSWVVM